MTKIAGSSGHELHEATRAYTFALLRFSAPRFRIAFALSLNNGVNPRLRYVVFFRRRRDFILEGLFISSFFWREFNRARINPLLGHLFSRPNLAFFVNVVNHNRPFISLNSIAYVESL